MSEETTTLTPPETPPVTPEVNTATAEQAADNSLESRLSLETERKQPTAVASLADSPGFWGDDEAEEITAESSGQPKSGQSNEASAPITKEAFRTSARTGVLLLDNAQKLIFTFLVNRKYSRKLTDEQWTKVDQIIDLDKSAVAAEDLPLYSKAQKVMRKWQKKTEAIPMTEKEQKSLEDQLYEYCKMTGKTLSPNLILVLSLVNSVGGRAIDLITD